MLSWMFGECCKAKREYTSLFHYQKIPSSLVTAVWTSLTIQTSRATAREVTEVLLGIYMSREEVVDMR